MIEVPVLIDIFIKEGISGKLSTDSTVISLLVATISKSFFLRDDILQIERTHQGRRSIVIHCIYEYAESSLILIKKQIRFNVLYIKSYLYKSIPDITNIFLFILYSMNC